MKFQWIPEEPFDPKAAQHLAPHDWAGQWLTRSLQVIDRVADTKSGKRQWHIRCVCGGEYIVPENMMIKPQMTICPCNANRRLR